MATMTLKNVPEELFERLKRSAKRNGRSLDKEAIACLEHALSGREWDSGELLVQIRAARAEMHPLFVTNADLRAARDDGRP